MLRPVELDLRYWHPYLRGLRARDSLQVGIDPGIIARRERIEIRLVYWLAGMRSPQPASFTDPVTYL